VLNNGRTPCRLQAKFATETQLLGSVSSEDPDGRKEEKRLLDSKDPRKYL
jgi:hypothetical protein